MYMAWREISHNFFIDNYSPQVRHAQTSCDAFSMPLCAQTTQTHVYSVRTRTRTFSVCLDRRETMGGTNGWALTLRLRFALLLCARLFFCLAYSDILHAQSLQACELTHSLRHELIITRTLQENVDNDDGSCFYNTHDNFFVYGSRGMKNDFGGHDNHHANNVYVAWTFSYFYSIDAIISLFPCLFVTGG